ncbi:MULTISPECIES: long-chain-fatty-acid--CoA ligase [Sphingopyxis]|uniref:long-chain-fatty-acid--CoA ligase n=1 Tax=Sphingopyxis TaxID=165697 RepID=UPI00086C94BE|nr:MULTISPECIES: long-chain-fatty-acid--CoA ligase [Sphingopyxis]APW71653.1 acyl-CoA synthetase [Sphingopyxis granuli]AVA15608.1 acyl-CoA synthetase [Sphingopyxis sp. MG]ODU33708.1 MAG: acyl-CoA synthetase [Sphingopyxis sp. SCN 67-31]
MIDLDAIRTLADIPAAQARKRGDAVAVKFGDRETRFAELDAQSNRVAHALIAAGVVPGDRVSVLTKNHDAWYPLFFGTARARACLAPINCRLAAGEIEFILGDAGPKLLFVGEDFFDTALAAVAGLPNPPRLVALYGAHPAFESLDAWIGDAPATPPADEPQLGDDVLQLYTSGTTGRPKGVVLANRTYRRFLEMATEIDGFAYDEDETVMIVMPLFHVAGTNVSFSGLAQGGRLVLVKDFAAGDAIAMLSEERVAHAFLAPAMIQMMLQQPGAETGDYARLRSIAYGASPIAEDVLRRARAVFGCDFVQFYGMTESAGGGSYLSPAAHDLPGKLTSCGQPWPGAEMAILDGEGRPLGDGEIGEIAIRGDIVMKEYWNRPEATAETVVDGWLHTGDVGYRDADGYYFVHDRIKDMIVSGGENVYPAEVESAIMGCPGVADVAVIGVPDARWGEAVKALIVPAPGAEVAADDVIAWARERIAAYKAPKSVDIIDALPRNPSGKVLRRELRAPYWEGRDRAVG